MSDVSANLALPYLAASQAQKHVTHNEALQILDTVVQLSVADRDRTDPPPAPVAGTRHIVSAGATGLWAGQDGRLALWTGNAWSFLDPRPGWRAWAEAEAVAVVWHNGTWQQLPSPSVLENMVGVGVNATADPTNRLAVSAPATLFSHEGAGHQLKINKATAGDTASLLFQSGWSGRAEMGLAGTDAWAIKVSPDGTSWTEALALDPATGQATGAAVQSAAGDATSGRLMTVGAFGLGGNAIQIAALALDAVDASGLYRLSEAVPPVLDAGGRVLHVQGSANSATQMGFRSDSDSLVCRRKSGGIWQGWHRIVSQANLLGTVSQSGGLPSGAVMERGSNANGAYVRFADGTQICTRTLSNQGPIASSVGAVSSLASDIGWTFPAAFQEIPCLSVSVPSHNAIWGVSSGTSGSTTAVHFNLYRPGPLSSTAISVRLSAIGKWF